MKYVSQLKVYVLSLFMVTSVAGIAPAAFGKSKPAPKKHPYILMITLEDTSPQFVGCYGNKDAHTPVIDQLAREGVRFTNAFSTGTVCSPSRSTIITGVRTYKMGTGNHRSHYPIPSYIKGFPYYMRKAGYFTTNHKKTDYNIANEAAFDKEAWNECSIEAGWWHRKPGQPFFSVFNYMDSHQSRTMTWPYKKYQVDVYDKLPVHERIADTAFAMPPFYRDSPSMRKQVARVYNSLRLTDNEVGELLKHLEADHLRDSTIIFLFADHGEGIPRGKTNGIDLGYRVPFIIWFPEMYKNLSPWGTGVVTDELVDFEDLAPTMLSLAGAKIPDYLKGRILLGKNRSRPVDHLILSEDRSDNGIDMIRSVTDGKYTYSRNFMPFMYEVRYIRYMEVGAIKQQMRKDLAAKKLDSLQKALFDPRPAESLYDIKNDPWQTKNLATDPQYAPVLKRMRNWLKQSIIRSRDVMFLPEYEIYLISKHTTPYEYRLDKKLYPLEKIYAAASLAGERGKDIAAKQVKLLNNDNKIVRYWAMLGLKSQPQDVLQPYRKEILSAMNDNYPPVAVTAASVSYDVFGSRQGEDELKKYCNDDNWYISLMGINYLLYMDKNKKEPFVSTIKNVYEGRKTKEKSFSLNKAKDKIPVPRETALSYSFYNYNVEAACLDFLGSLGLVPNTFQYRR